MSTATAPTLTVGGTDHEVIHYACCVANVALCGEPLDSPPDPTLPDPDCVVCVDLEEHAHQQCPVRALCIQHDRCAGPARPANQRGTT